jgi:hypothetical protein
MEESERERETEKERERKRERERQIERERGREREREGEKERERRGRKFVGGWKRGGGKTLSRQKGKRCCCCCKCSFGQRNVERKRISRAQGVIKDSQLLLMPVASNLVKALGK